MSPKLLLICAVVLLVSAVGQSQVDYTYYSSIPTGAALGGVALKPDGDLYYVTFAAANSELVYVQNALLGYATSTITTEVLPAGRGLNDIEVDSAGNVYISGTGTAAADSVLKKFSAAPSHTELWSNIDYRHNGIELITDDILAIGQTWNVIVFKNTSDGSDTGTSVSGGSRYQRAFAFNTANDDIYAAKNGDYSDAALKVFSGGSPTNLSGYALALDDQLSPLGVSTPYGTATQPVDYDPINDQLLMGDTANQAIGESTGGVRVYDISGSGASTSFTEAQFVDRRDATYYYSNVYGISYANVTAFSPPREFLAIAANVTDGTDSFYSIELFRRVPLSVEDWADY